MRYRKRDKENAGAERVLFALVGDYENRKRAAEKAQRAAAHSDDVKQLIEIEMFMETNRTIDECLAFIEPYLRPYIREDIANRRGWEKSQASPYISQHAYFARKNEAIEKMLVAFRLILPKNNLKNQ